jgi:hypothetical protein
MRAILITFVVGLMVLSALPALAQQVEIRVTPPERETERGIIAPGDHYEATRPSDSEFYPEGTRVRHDPTFIAPLSRKTETGRVGFAGWTAPNTPVGTRQLGHREVPGWFAFGIAVEWGGPPPRRAAR